MKGTIKRILMMLLVLTVLVPVVSIDARVSLNELQAEHRNLQNAIRQARNEIANINRHIGEAEREMEKLDEQIMVVMEHIIIVDIDIERQLERYEQAIIELDAARVFRDAQERIVHDRLRALHERGQASLLDVLVQSTGVRDFMFRMEWMNQVARQDQQMLQQLEEAETRYLASVEDEARQRNALDLLRNLLIRTIAELDALMTEWEERHEFLMSERLTFEQMRDANLAQERTVAQQIAREQERIRAEEEAERQRQLAARANLRGQYLWPVPGFWRVSSPFGNRPNPFNRNQTQHHNGIDIAGTNAAGQGINGANIVAVAYGFVSRASNSGWNGGYGRMVIIDHGNGMSTLYAHMSHVGVREGQEVNAGEVIGRVGSTGSSTGPHLHFEVRQNNRAVNPAPFLGL
jgi:murein DD-endopeptidase MepM/ murein hydrolase activator NlpD